MQSTMKYYCGIIQIYPHVKLTVVSVFLCKWAVLGQNKVDPI